MGILSILILIPLIGSAVVAFLPTSPTRSKQLALLFTAAAFIVGVIAFLQFDPAGEQFQLIENYTWIPALGVSFAIGVDGLGLVMVFLATLLTPLVILAGWNDVEDAAAQNGADESEGQVRGYFGLMLLMQAMTLTVFLALDVFLFYFIFEAVLIPVYFMIGRYGVGRRTYAAVKFLVYSLAGGLVMLAGLAVLWFASIQVTGEPNLYLPDLIDIDIDPTLQTWIFWAFFIAFAIKAPLWPLHTWLPDASGSATPGTAILLIGVLDKLGTFGMLRFCLPLFPEAAQSAAPVIVVLSLISIFYGGLLAIGQTDMKRMFGYVSLSHFGFIILGIFVFTTQGQVGSAFYMLGHGLSTALLFMVAGYMIARRHTSTISEYHGLSTPTPVLAGMMLFAGLTAVALPGMSTFVSEFLVLLGTFVRNPWVGAIATLGIVLAAVYILLFYQNTMTGKVTEKNKSLKDLNLRERVALAPIVVVVVVLGFYPAPVLDVLNPYVDDVMAQVGTTDPPSTIPLATEGAQP